MLVLSMNPEDFIQIGFGIQVKYLKQSKNSDQIKIGITASKNITIASGKVLKKIMEEENCNEFNALLIVEKNNQNK